MRRRKRKINSSELPLKKIAVKRMRVKMKEMEMKMTPKLKTFLIVHQKILKW